jgi:hypothetical protein
MLIHHTNASSVSLKCKFGVDDTEKYFCDVTEVEFFEVFGNIDDENVESYSGEKILKSKKLRFF